MLIGNYFIKQILSYNVLSEGVFELSSGITSNYYYEFEKFNDGRALSVLGYSFLVTAKELQLDYDVIYGTAYKGIFVALAMTSVAWEQDFFGRGSHSIPCVVERKESKNRNNKGLLIGAPIEGKKILLVDDVATTFGSLENSMSIIKNYNPKSVSILVGVDRSGVNPYRIDGILVHSIVTHQEVINMIPKGTEYGWIENTL